MNITSKFQSNIQPNSKVSTAKNSNDLQNINYIENTGIKDFKLVKGTQIKEMLTKSKSNESIKEKNASPIRMINIQELV